MTLYDNTIIESVNFFRQQLSKPLQPLQSVHIMLDTLKNFTVSYF